MVPSAPDTRLGLAAQGVAGEGRFHRVGCDGAPDGSPSRRGRSRRDRGVAESAPIDAAVGFGATEGDGPRGVVDASEITILCVPNSPDVVAVLDDAMPALGPGKIVVDTSTIDPEVEREQHERVSATGARVPRSATVRRHSRRPEGRADPDGRAATRQTLDAARPVLDTFAGLIVHVGGPGHGAGREALQQPHLRRADAGDRRGDRDGGAVGRRSRSALRGADPRDR